MNRSPTRGRTGPPRTAHPVVDVLSRSDVFSRLAPGLEQLAALQAQLDAALPPYLRTDVAPAALRERVLTLMTPHSALAARLRHLEPALLGRLQQQGWGVDSLKIRVRPLAAVPKIEPKAARVSAVGVACLAELHRNTEPSPLKDALGRMLARHRGA